MARSALPLSAGLIASLLVGCGDAEVAAPRREPVAPKPAACRRGPVEVLGDRSPDGASIALAWNAEGGLVAWVGEDRAAIRPLDAGGSATGPWRPAPLPGARAAQALLRAPSEDLLLARGVCDEGPRCLLAVALAADGTVRRPPARTPIEGAIVTARRAIMDDGVVLAFSTDSGAAAVHRYRTDEDALRVEIVTLGGPPDPELPREILGLATNGVGWAALWRSGATEDSRSDVHLSTRGHHRSVEALHEALVIEAARLEDDELTVIAGFEFSRPHLLRLPLAEREPREARELPPGAGAPPPFAAEPRARLAVDERGLWLRRRSVVGDEIGDRVSVIERPVSSAAVARRGSTFLVSWIDASTGRLEARRLRCEPRGSP